jgi:hypothetical protein
VHSNRRFWALLVAVLAFDFMIEVATLDLGHELPWFGHASQQAGATVRYVILGASLLGIVAAVAVRARGRDI